MFLTEKEIFSQYEALRRTYDYMLEKADSIRDLVARHNPKSLTFIGCGSSYCLCRSGSISTKIRVGMAANAMAAGDLLVNFDQYKEMLEGTVIIAPSRSGGTSEVILAVEKAQVLGVPVIGISARVDSPLGKIADVNLEIPWAFDESVCQTRTVTNLYAANLLLVGIIAGDDSLIEEIDQAIANGDEFMNKYSDLARENAEQDWENVVILADGELEGIASEAAIAMIEIPQIHASYYHVLDVRHGPMVLIDDKTLVIAALSPAETTLQQKLVEDLRDRGARVLAISQEGQGPWTDGVILFTRCNEFLSSSPKRWRSPAKGLEPRSPPAGSQIDLINDVFWTNREEVKELC